MRKPFALALTLGLTLAVALPSLSACGSKEAAPETSPDAAQGADITPDDLVGTTWCSASTAKDSANFRLEFPSRTRCYLTWVAGTDITSAQRFSYMVKGQDIDMQQGVITGSIGSDLGRIKLDFPDGSTCMFVPDDREKMTLEQCEELVEEVDPVFNSNGRRSKAVAPRNVSKQDKSSSDAKDSGKLEDEVLGSVCVRVRLPSDWANKGLKWDVKSNKERVTLFYTDRGKEIALADVSWDKNADLDRDVAEEIWELGDVMFEKEVRPAVLHVPYIDKNGKNLVANADTSKADLASMRYLDLSATKIMSWVELVADEDDVNGLSKRQESFCGVWSYASKKLDDAVRSSNEARQRGFAAEVFYSDDWTGLEDVAEEPMYLVTLGCAYSEEEAESVLDNAHFEGYDNAFIQWSGNRQ